MKTSRFCLRMGSLIALSLILAQAAKADFYLHPWMNHQQGKQLLEIKVTSDYFSTTQNFDSYGKLFIPSQLQNYSRFGADLTGSLGWTERLTFFGNLSWARTQVDTVTATGSSFGLADQMLGANYRVIGSSTTGHTPSRLLVDLQNRLDIPAYSNSDSDLNDSPWLGDASQDFSVGGFLKTPLLQKQTRTLFLEGGLAYTYRSGGFSSALPWSVFLDLDTPEKGWLFRLGMSGLYSLNTDPTTPNSSKSAGTGGSFMSNAINPTLMTVAGQLGYRLDRKFDIITGASQSIAGHNAPAGFQIFGGLLIRIGGSAPTLSPAKLSPAEYGKSNQGFVNYQGAEAKVLKTNDRLNIIKINKGSNDGVELGQNFDIFSVKPNGEIGDAVARGRVSSIKGDEAVLSVTEYFREVWIDEGFVARRPIE